MGPPRMRQAVRSHVVNSIPKCYNTRTPVKGMMCQNNPNDGILMSVPCSHHCVLRTSGGASEQVMLRLQLYTFLGFLISILSENIKCGLVNLLPATKCSKDAPGSPSSIQFHPK